MSKPEWGRRRVDDQPYPKTRDKDVLPEGLKPVTLRRTSVKERPRVFYRGTVPGETKKIKTGDDYWDSHLFVSSSRELASSYGKNIEVITASEDARILYEGTRDFVRTAGRYDPRKENYLSYLSRAVLSAEELGYDAVHFKRQGDVGTAIINPEKFFREND